MEKQRITLERPVVDFAGEYPSWPQKPETGVAMST
jgi:hypothetical protein